MQRTEYAFVRGTMQAGDIIAFSGTGGVSEIVRFATRSVVSHVGIILQSKLLLGDTPQAGYFNQIIESTSLDGFSGVTITRLSDRLATYDGEIWWLPLSFESRERLDGARFYDFLLHQDRKPYDVPQAIRSALTLLHNTEDFSRFFCSELAAAGLEAGGVIQNINASEVTPGDLCSFTLYGSDYYQIKGADRTIRGFNSVSPEGWGM